MERKGGRIERVKGYKSRDDGVEGTKVSKAKNTSIFSNVFRVFDHGGQPTSQVILEPLLKVTFHI